MSPSCRDNPGVRMVSGCPGLCPSPPGPGQPPALLLQVLASTKAGAVGKQMGKFRSSGPFADFMSRWHRW